MGIERVPHTHNDRIIRQHVLTGLEEEIPARADAERAGALTELQHRVGNSGMQRLLTQGNLRQPGHAGAVMALQQRIGNSAVQRLLAQGNVRPRKDHLAFHLQREGDCDDCGGTHEEDELTAAFAGDQTVQRFWDDDEDEGSSDEDDGGGITDWLSDTVSEIGETVGGWFGGDESEGGGSNNESGGGWWDEEDGSGSETESEDDTDDGGGSWWPWDSNDTEDDETPEDIPQVKAECETDEGVGFGSGSGKSFSLHGSTDANYDHGKPIPAPFPSSITVTTKEVGKSKTQVFSAHGTFDATYKASPTVTLPTVPSGLTPCQEQAVREFINGPLTAHEQDHVNAFTSNYDGTVTLKVDHDNIIDNPTNRQNAMENPVNKEDVKRTTKANKASKKLDPWKKKVTGLDCKD